jgi:hypothetical protein
MHAARKLAANTDLFSFFDYVSALRNLEEELLCEALSPQECSRRYTGIYTKVLFIVASIEKEKTVRKYDPHEEYYYDETRTWEDATVIAIERLPSLLIPPEDHLPIQEKLKLSQLMQLQLKS